MQRTTFQTLPFLKLWIPHFLSRKPIGKSKTIFTAYSFLLLFTVLYNFAKLQTKFERLSSFFKSTVSNTSKWHLFAQVQVDLSFNSRVMCVFRSLSNFGGSIGQSFAKARKNRLYKKYFWLTGLCASTFCNKHYLESELCTFCGACNLAENLAAQNIIHNNIFCFGWAG